MTVRKTHGLELVVRLARQEESEAAARLQQAQGWVAESQNRLEALQRYLEEYRERARAAAAVLARDMHEERRFLIQLEETLETQSRLLEQQRRGAEAARSTWLALRQRRDGLETLLEQRVRRDIDRRERAEQQRLDDRPRLAALGSRLLA